MLKSPRQQQDGGSRYEPDQAAKQMRETELNNAQ
jgi:hypothetical protein